MQTTCSVRVLFTVSWILMISGETRARATSEIVRVFDPISNGRLSALIGPLVVRSFPFVYFSLSKVRVPATSRFDYDLGRRVAPVTDTPAVPSLP
ncbi:hypothetical protein BC835DRAFT_1362612 [Cytidiella melzeri]|nr:hypothetical protein BC835DRAFT_1362612 [Cytidiella melzeri]